MRTFGRSSFNDGPFIIIDYDLPSIPGFTGFKEKMLGDIKRQAILAELKAEKGKKEQKLIEKELSKELNIFNKKYAIRRAPFTKCNRPLYDIILKLEAEKVCLKKGLTSWRATKFILTWFIITAGSLPKPIPCGTWLSLQVS